MELLTCTSLCTLPALTLRATCQTRSLSRAWVSSPSASLLSLFSLALQLAHRQNSTRPTIYRAFVAWLAMSGVPGRLGLPLRTQIARTQRRRRTLY